MKRWALVLLLAVTAGALTFAACGGGSGGGTKTTLPAIRPVRPPRLPPPPPPRPPPIPTSPRTRIWRDLELRRRQLQRRFGWHDGRLVQFTNSNCSSQICNANMFLNTDTRYSIKFTNYGWCTASSRWLKFAMNWTDGTKQTGHRNRGPSLRPHQ